MAASPALNLTEPEYDAVITATPLAIDTETFTSLSAAVLAGKKNIFVAPGTYVETQALTLNAGTVIDGANTQNTYIIFAGLSTPAISFSLNDAMETNGTVSIDPGLPHVVTGSGTTFTNLSAGQQILLGNAFFTIASITNDTTLAIQEVYQGAAVVDAPFVALTLATSMRFQNIAIVNSPTTPCSNAGVSLSNLRGVLFKNVLVSGFVDNVCAYQTAVFSGTRLVSYSSQNHGIYLQSIWNGKLDTCGSVNNVGDGIVLSGFTESSPAGSPPVWHGSYNINLSTLHVLANGGAGIRVENGCRVVHVHGCILEHNTGDALVCDDTVRNVQVNACTVVNNGNGVMHNGDNNTITSCIISDNNGVGVKTGAEALITGNTIAQNASYGVDVGVDHCTSITANVIHDNGDHGITLGGTTQACTISSNSIFSNAGDAIHIQGTESDGNNTIVGNTIRNNTGEGIYIESRHNVINSNRCTGNQNGVVITADGTAPKFTVLCSNNLVGNTVLNLDDQSASTHATVNIL